ncbi:MAG: hypothetical protein ABW101_05070 [Candidatus Thiodiazotropha sp.]
MYSFILQRSVLEFMHHAGMPERAFEDTCRAQPDGACGIVKDSPQPDNVTDD